MLGPVREEGQETSVWIDSASILFSIASALCNCEIQNMGLDGPVAGVANL